MGEMCSAKNKEKLKGNSEKYEFKIVYRTVPESRKLEKFVIAIKLLIALL